MGKLAIQLTPYYHTFYEGVERVYCLNYANSSGELAATRFIYDKKGRNTMAFYQEISGNRSSKNFHKFDPENRIISKSREYSDGETSKEEFNFDETGRLVEESYSDSKGREGTARYEYDDAGRATRMVCNGYKGWMTGVITFAFDSRGKRLKGTIENEGQPCGFIKYQYGTSGSLIHEHWEIGDNWSQTLQYVYEEA
jgi:hypothetical protein